MEQNVNLALTDCECCMHGYAADVNVNAASVPVYQRDEEKNIPRLGPVLLAP